MSRLKLNKLLHKIYSSEKFFQFTPLFLLLQKLFQPLLLQKKKAVTSESTALIYTKFLSYDSQLLQETKLVTISFETL